MASDRAIQALADVATTRLDDHEERLRSLEDAEAKRKGAATQAEGVRGWITTVIALAALWFSATR